MSYNNEEEKSNKGTFVKALIIIILLSTGTGALVVYKPYGDRYPFEDFLYSKTKTGLKYWIKSKGDKKEKKTSTKKKKYKIKKGNMILFSCSYRKKKEKKNIFDSKSMKLPMKYDESLIKKGQNITSVLQEGAKTLGQPGVIWMQITAKDIFVDKEGKINKKALNENKLTADSKLIFNMGIEKILNEEQYLEEEKKKMGEFKKKMETRHEVEKEIISIDIEKGKHSGIKKLDSGVAYKITKRNNGKGVIQVKEGDQVEVEYTLYSINEKLKENEKVLKSLGKVSGKTEIRALVKKLKLKKELIGKPKDKVSFRLGSNPPQVISGWEQTLRKLKIDESAKIWIPASSGYSIFGNGRSIPPNTILYYEVTVTNVFVPMKKDSSSKPKASPRKINKAAPAA